METKEPNPQWMASAARFATLTDLAAAYHPTVEPISARRTLLRTIRMSPLLLHELEQVGFKTSQRLVYPGQCIIIFRHLGVPQTVQ